MGPETVLTELQVGL